MSDFLQGLQAFCGIIPIFVEKQDAMIGIEAWTLLQYWTEDRGKLEDPTVDYLAERIEEMDAAAVLQAMSILMERLDRLGDPERQRLQGREERLRITRDFRILLPDRFDAEIRLRPLVKTVFLLFLRHPEGIRFGDLKAYRDELTALYGHISGRDDPAQIRQSIERLTDPKDNSIHEKASNLSAALSRYFTPGSLPLYHLSGRPGEPKRILLDRCLVEWDETPFSL